MTDDIIFTMADSEQCDMCNGHGIYLNTYTGDPDDCPECGGSGQTLTASGKKKLAELERREARK